MTHKERMLASIRGERIDRIPFAPRWELWFDSAVREGTLPEKYRGWSLFDVARDLGWGIKGNKGKLYELRRRNVKIVETRRGLDTFTEYETPFGTVSNLFRLTPELDLHGVRGLEIEHMIKGPDDYAPVMHIIENTEVVPTYDEFEEYEKSVGDDGIAMGEAGFSPFHLLMREYVGYQNTYYELHDRPEAFQRLLETLEVQHREIVRVAVNSPAFIIRYDGNYDSRMTPPPVYRRYFLPFFKYVAEECHKAGKLLCTHTDGEHSLLMDEIRDSGFDICEAFTTPPMTQIGVADARDAWGPDMVIWGAVASTVLCPRYSEEEFERHVLQIIREAAPGNRFIMGTGDNLPTDGLLERMLRIDELCRTEGRFPVDPVRARVPAGPPGP